MEENVQQLQLVFSEAGRILRHKYRTVLFENIEDALSFSKVQFFSKMSFSMFGSSRQLMQWCVTVSEHSLLHELQRSRRFSSLDQSPVQEMTVATNSRYEDAQHIASLLESLPVTYRIVVEKKLQGNSLSEIAADLGLTYEAVKRRWQRAKRKMTAGKI